MRYKTYTMGEVGEIVSGATPKTTDPENFGGDIAWLTPADLSGYSEKYISHGARNLTEKGYNSCSTQLMPAGSVLFTSRAPIGYVAIAANPICTNQGFKSIIPKDIVESEFLYYQLIYLKRIIQDMGSGTTFKEISAKKLATVRVVIPPLHEQQRIVARIEELFSQLDSGVETLRKTKQQLAVYRQAVLKEAFDGRGICVRKIKDACIKEFAEVGTGATPLTTNKAYYGGNIPWITSGKINDGDIYSPTEYITELAINETNCKIYPAHTLLVAMYGEGKTRGKCAELLIPAATNQALAAIVLDDNAIVEKSFLKWFLAFNYENIRLKAVGGVQPNINLNIVKNIAVPIFSKYDQIRIVGEIESRLSVCDSIEQTVDAALQQAAALRQSILKQAFEGEL